ncbi:MAG: hypothetical protein ACYTHK_19090 [Planctomycetota bacterium]|jgi:hypothetical protein
MGHLLLVIILAPLILFGACGTTLHEQREVGLRNAKTDLERGQVYYETSCQRCHALYMPKSFNGRSWERYVRRYGPRARLDVDQKELVIEYLRANARDAKPSE